ncbi:MAG TPA: TolC family protein, partial [Candidatus Limnocylindrales bacterium]|nr:TolC family protein [Candidatus Limnocylindrales bacterium]
MKPISSVLLVFLGVLISGLPAISQEVNAPLPAGQRQDCAKNAHCLFNAPPTSLSTAETDWAQVMAMKSGSEQGGTSAQANQPSGGAVPKLGLHDAEQLAIKNHPRITIAQLSALASKEVARQVRSAYFPTINFNATGVTTYHDGNRITAGALNNPSVFDRAGSGLVASQLITDFGRTSNLNSAANLHAQAQQQNALATREQIVFAVDQAFYDALSTDVLVKVADQTVQSRQVLVNQVDALEKAKLRSALDLSFASVSLAQAQLLLVNAKSNRDAAYATLTEALGLPNQQPF